MAIKYSTIGGSTGTGFNVQVGSKYSYAQFTTAQPAGAYTIKSSNNYTNWDVYLLDASNNLVAYTGTASISPVSAFSAIVVVNGTVNDILGFSYQSTVFATATTSQTKAGPFITAFGSSVIPNQNSAVTITGGNFAVGITATFTGTDSVVRTCKSVVYTSSSSISVVRPDTLPIAYAPYTLTLTNPGVNNPATSQANILTGLTVGAAPVWSTATSLAAASGNTAYSATVVATDPDAGGSISYSYVSGALPTGLSFNAGIGVISGTYSGLTDGSVSYTIRATDSGGNFTDRTFTIAYTGVGGGTLTSDATYYYRVFTSNGTLTVPSTLSSDILVVGGGGAAGNDVGGAGGAGGVIYFANQSLTASNYPIVVGAGGSSNGNNGISSQFGALTVGLGGGGGGTYNSTPGNSGGSGGGGGGGATNAGGSSTQSSSGATAAYGNAGGAANNISSYASGGGGGAGTVAGPSGNLVGGNGGNGTSAFSSWLSAISSVMTGVSGWSTATNISGTWYIAGGGGGGAGADASSGTPGTGGYGGGAAGHRRDTLNASPGTTNTGGGAGGHASPNTGGASGGSGLVIVRYTRTQVGG
jgi:Putative Ig domain